MYVYTSFVFFFIKFRSAYHTNGRCWIFDRPTTRRWLISKRKRKTSFYCRMLILDARDGLNEIHNSTWEIPPSKWQKLIAAVQIKFNNKIKYTLSCGCCVWNVHDECVCNSAVVRIAVNPTPVFYSSLQIQTPKWDLCWFEFSSSAVSIKLSVYLSLKIKYRMASNRLKPII